MTFPGINILYLKFHYFCRSSNFLFQIPWLFLVLKFSFSNSITFPILIFFFLSQIPRVFQVLKFSISKSFPGLRDLQWPCVCSPFPVEWTAPRTVLCSPPSVTGSTASSSLLSAPSYASWKSRIIGERSKWLGFKQTEEMDSMWNTDWRWWGKSDQISKHKKNPSKTQFLNYHILYHNHHVNCLNLMIIIVTTIIFINATIIQILTISIKILRIFFNITKHQNPYHHHHHERDWPLHITLQLKVGVLDSSQFVQLVLHRPHALQLLLQLTDTAVWTDHSEVLSASTITVTVDYSQTHMILYTHAHTLTLTHMQIHTVAHTHTHTHTHTQSHSLTYTHTHTHTHTHTPLTTVTHTIHTPTHKTSPHPPTVTSPLNLCLGFLEIQLQFITQVSPCAQVVLTFLQALLLLLHLSLSAASHTYWNA